MKKLILMVLLIVCLFNVTGCDDKVKVVTVNVQPQEAPVENQ